ncbi:MAG: CocE/NonD family hydrolase [Rhodococcus sp.]|nr:CocE/NonD family hydrolase [Rhodococcus sp. (in: high G+C Gram-positive bacteria)]
MGLRNSSRGWVTRRLGAGIVAAALVAVGTLSAAPTAAAAPHWEPPATSPPIYPDVHITWDVPITMSDGVVLKANVYRPIDAQGHIVDEPLPTIVNLTPYTKLVSMIAESAMSIPVLSDAVMTLAGRADFSMVGLSGLSDLANFIDSGTPRSFAVDRNLIRSGYTQVVVDVRGTGFSQGEWQVFQAREQLDTLEVLEWSRQQPWSNGTLGMSGMSYSAINQVQAASKRPEGLEAIFPIVPSQDLMRDVIAPGGTVGIGFLPMWLTLVNTLKMAPDLHSIATGTFDWAWLASRVEHPLVFFELLLAALVTPTVDDIPPHLTAMLDDSSSIRNDMLTASSNVDIPTFVVGGWHDLFTNSQVGIYEDIPLPPGQKQLLMGEWYHLTIGAGLGQPAAPPRLDSIQHAWFDKWLKGIDNGIENFGPVTVFEQGGGWVTSSQYPLAGTEYQRMYLSAASSGTAPLTVHDGSLASAPGDPARLTIAPGLSTVCSRDSAQQTVGIIGIVDACGKDSRISELGALTFTSAPVAEPTQISGRIGLELNTVHDVTDGYWTATVNDVAPDGTSRVVSSGQLMASVRAVDESQSVRASNGDLVAPHHVLTLATRQPLVPGEPTTLNLGLTATAAVLQPGHRLRVDVYAANFPKGLPLRPLLNESQLRPQHLELDPARPSFVTVPVVGRIPG